MSQIGGGIYATTADRKPVAVGNRLVFATQTPPSMDGEKCPCEICIYLADMVLL